VQADHPHARVPALRPRRPHRRHSARGWPRRDHPYWDDELDAPSAAQPREGTTRAGRSKAAARTRALCV